MRAPRDIREFVSYVERRPERLGAWRAGADDRHATVAWINGRCIEILSALFPRQPGRKNQDENTVAKQDVVFQLHSRAVHNVVGSATGWAALLMDRPGRPQKPADQAQDRAALLDVANDYWLLRDALAEVRGQVRGFTIHGSSVVMPYLVDHRLDVLDHELSTVDLRLEIFGTRQASAQEAFELNDGEDIKRPWAELPRYVRDGYLAISRAVASQYFTYLPETGEIAGFSVRDFNEYWIQLLARGWHMHVAYQSGSRELPVVAPLIARDYFIRDLADSACIGLTTAARITSELTQDIRRCADGSLTPLSSIDDGLVPLSLLVMGSSPQRNLLVALAQQKRLEGAIGNRLGDDGEETTASMLKSRLAKGMLVHHHIDVRVAGRRQAGDLDVVVCDPASRRLAVFEIRWDFGLDDLVEAYRIIKDALTDKRAQLIERRSGLANGMEFPNWPDSWPKDVGDYEIRWFVLTRSVLPTRSITEDAITARSFQLLHQRLRPGATFDDLLRLLDDPPLPSSEECPTYWHKMRYGDLRIEIERIQV